MTISVLSLDLIRTDGGTQMRAQLNQDVYLEYRDQWLAQVEFGPIDVFFDGSVYWLADGFHRFYGAREANRSSIPCRIHQGTRRDATLFAIGANDKHGLRRSNADKRVAVLALLNDEEWCNWSDNRIAEQASVSDVLVASVRKQLQESCGSNGGHERSAEPVVRVGRDGRTRRVSTKPRKKLKSPPSREPGEDKPERRHVEAQKAADATPFDEPLAGIDFVLDVAVPKVQEFAILAEQALGSGKATFSSDRISMLMKQVHDSFHGIRGVIANAQQRHRRKTTSPNVTDENRAKVGTSA